MVLVVFAVVSYGLDFVDQLLHVVVSVRVSVEICVC